MIVAFTGHRPSGLGGYPENKEVRDKVQSALHRALTEIDPQGAISGMAQGVDQWAAEVCTRMGIPWCAAIPFEGQDSVWTAESQAYYRSLLKLATSTCVVSAGGYAGWKMQIRNQWMVDRCDILVAVWDGSAGGTSNCVRYAEKVGRKIHRINPKELLVSRQP